MKAYDYQEFVRVDNLNFSKELAKFGSKRLTTPPEDTDRHDQGDLVTEYFHSSDDGLEAVEIPLDNPSERAPLIEGSTDCSTRSPVEEHSHLAPG